MTRISFEVSTRYNITSLARAVKLRWLHQLLFYKRSARFTVLLELAGSKKRIRAYVILY